MSNIKLISQTSETYRLVCRCGRCILSCKNAACCNNTTRTTRCYSSTGNEMNVRDNWTKHFNTKPEDNLGVNQSQCSLNEMAVSCVLFPFWFHFICSALVAFCGGGPRKFHNFSWIFFRISRKTRFSSLFNDSYGLCADHLALGREPSH